jgi:hypothetical protein
MYSGEGQSDPPHFQTSSIFKCLNSYMYIRNSINFREMKNKEKLFLYIKTFCLFYVSHEQHISLLWNYIHALTHAHNQYVGDIFDQRIPTHILT